MLMRSLCPHKYNETKFSKINIFAEGSCFNAYLFLNGIKKIASQWFQTNAGDLLDYKLTSLSEPAGMGLVQKCVMVVK